MGQIYRDTSPFVGRPLARGILPQAHASGAGVAEACNRSRVTSRRRFAVVSPLPSGLGSIVKFLRNYGTNPRRGGHLKPERTLSATQWSWWLVQSDTRLGMGVLCIFRCTSVLQDPHDQRHLISGVYHPQRRLEDVASLATAWEQQ